MIRWHNRLRLRCQPLPPAVTGRPRCQLHPLLLVPCVDMMIGFVPHHLTQNTSCCQEPAYTMLYPFSNLTLRDTSRVYDRLFKYECLSPKGLKMLQSGDFTAHRNYSESTRFLTAVLDKWRNIWYDDKLCWSKQQSCSNIQAPDLSPLTCGLNVLPKQKPPRICPSKTHTQCVSVQFVPQCVRGLDLLCFWCSSDPMFITQRRGTLLP